MSNWAGLPQMDQDDGEYSLRKTICFVRIQRRHKKQKGTEKTEEGKTMESQTFGHLFVGLGPVGGGGVKNIFKGSQGPSHIL